MEKMRVNGLEGLKLARKKSLAVGVTCMAIYDLLQALNGESLSAVFSVDGTLIPASTTPHCRSDIKRLCASCDRCQTEDGIQWENKEGAPQESAMDQHTILRGGN